MIVALSLRPLPGLKLGQARLAQPTGYITRTEGQQPHLLVEVARLHRQLPVGVREALLEAVHLRRGDEGAQSAAAHQRWCAGSGVSAGTAAQQHRLPAALPSAPLYSGGRSRWLTAVDSAFYPLCMQSGRGH